MIRLPGILKVLAVLGLDFYILFTSFGDIAIAASITAAISLYVLLGGYLALFKEGAVLSDKLPSHNSARLNEAKAQLVEDVRHTSSVDLSRLKLYLIPGDDDMQATAYGANCISVARGTFENADPITLNAVLAHEVSHIIHSDAEFNRAIFSSIMLVIALLSVMSAASIVVIFLLFLLLSGFGSWIGFLLFRGTTKAVGGIFSLIQKVIVLVYRTLLSLVSRHAEYRSDRYACRLGYGLQLAHFLEIAGVESRQLTISEAMYRSHPPAQRRIARLEEQLSQETYFERE